MHAIRVSARPSLVGLVAAMSLSVPFCAALSAQTITVTPNYPSIGLKATKQFAAQVTGLSNTAVTWSAGGTVGGNAKAGTISATGLYTAPTTMPAQNPVLITATSKSTPSVSGSVYVNLLAAGPTITSVTPNPIQTGTINVTIKGGTFQQYANVVENYNGTSVQLSTSTVTANSIQASGYLPANATSVTFTVINPGTVASNAIMVPVSNAQPSQYTLSVTNGSGSGSYAAGASVAITANAAPSGQVFKNWTGATVANPNAASTTLVMPAAATAVTANYVVSNVPQFTLNVVNGSGSGSYAAGTVVAVTANPPAAGNTFAGWTGGTVANASAMTTTITMPASGVTLTANYSAPAVSIPYPVQTHPRLWITQNDLPRLRSWATSANPVYQGGMTAVLAQAVSNYAQFAPFYGTNPQPASNYPDPGDSQGYTGLLSEENAVILAFNSLIDPNPSNRIQYAQMARNLIMYAMNQASQGTLSGAPFRDGSFPIYNRASATGMEWPLVVDWIYNAVDAQNQPILTAADKVTIRKVFLNWANICLTASTTGGDSPNSQVIGATNNAAQLLPNGQPYRMAANNYYTAHARLMTMMSLVIDPSDDAPLNGALPASNLGNTLRSYILDATGAWLYQQYAMYGEPSAIASAYGLGSGTGFGLASGGLPPEGFLYGVSYANLLEELLSLQTAGFNNPSYSGPQIALINTPMWDRYVKGVISSLTPTSQVPTQPGESYLGSVYQFAGYGDMLRLFITPDYAGPFALLNALENQNGQTTHQAEARWFAYNAPQGGAASLNYRITNNAYGWIQSIFYYMLFDPTVNLASVPDPRPGYPTLFNDPLGGRIVAHTDWTPGGTMFDYRASWESINHQEGNAGQFELFRNGEWLTKELSNYDNNGLGMTTYYHNSLGIQNTCTSCTNPASLIGSFEQGEFANGSQWQLGENAGDPTTASSNGPGYVFADTDMTNLYNKPNQWTPGNAFVQVTKATRSILWLNSDYIVTYDRATTLNPGLFKRYNLTLVTNPVINGKVATETLASGQQLFVQTLLPANATVAARNVVADLTTIAELEPSKYVMTVEEKSNPADIRFLHVLQGANAGASMIPATHVSSNSGTLFDGAVFGANAVYFPVNAGSFTGTSLPAPAGVHTVFVAGLTPNAAYSVSVQANGAANTVVVSPAGSGTTTDAAGLLRVAF